MLSIDTAAALRRALDSPQTHPSLKPLLLLRLRQLGVEGLADTCIAVVEPGDGIDEVAAAIGYPLTDEGEPTFDVAMLHSDGWFEAIFSFSDLTTAVFVQNDDQADAALIALLRANAVDAPATEAAREAG